MLENFKRVPSVIDKIFNQAIHGQAIYINLKTPKLKKYLLILLYENYLALAVIAL